jgi:hypothetical protein
VVHLIKLCVGITDIGHLRRVQSERLRRGEPLVHRTRNFPRRADEIAAGGSLYWVINGVLRIRQRVTAITALEGEGKGKLAALHLDPMLVAVEPRAVRAFQGWRYLAAEAAPRDLAEAPPAAGAEPLPESLRVALAELCLL